jgi:hypothetical protein
MAASVVAGKLATALHRRTHRVTSALAYAALEWVLIALLLINGLLAYAIARFADYFGLTPPCLLCSRVDRLFEADGGEAAGSSRRLRDVLCGAHAAEISALGYCLSHRRLAEACGMCEACLSSWKEMKIDAGEKGAVVACSCCQAAVVRNSLRELQDTREEHIEEKTAGEEQEEGHGYALLAQDEHEDDDEEQQEEVEVPQAQQQDEGESQEREDEKAATVEDGSLEAMAQGDETAPEDDRLVPVVALDEMTIADESGLHRDVEEGYVINRADYEQDSRDAGIGVVLEKKMPMLNSAIATTTDAIEDPIVPVSPMPHPEITSSDPDENSVLQVEDTAEEHIVVPQGNLVTWFSCSVQFLSISIRFHGSFLQSQKFLKMTA